MSAPPTGSFDPAAVRLQTVRVSLGGCGARGNPELFDIIRKFCGGLIEQRLIISSPYTNIAYLSGFAPIVLKNSKIGA